MLACLCWQPSSALGGNTHNEDRDREWRSGQMEILRACMHCGGCKEPARAILSQNFLLLRTCSLSDLFPQNLLLPLFLRTLSSPRLPPPSGLPLSLRASPFQTPLLIGDLCLTSGLPSSFKNSGFEENSFSLPSGQD